MPQHPSDPPQGLGQAYALFTAGKVAEALALAQKIVQQSPPQAELLNLAALCHLQLGAVTEAEQCWRQAVELKPDYSLYYNLGLLWHLQQRFSEAEAAFARSLKLNSDHAATHYHLANLLLEQRRLAEAESACQNALRLKPDFAEAYNVLGGLRQEQQRMDEAEQAFQKALRLRPDFADAANNLGILLQRLQRIKESEAAFRRAVASKPDFAEAWSNLGALLHGQKRFDGAEQACRRALALNPRHAEGYNNLGVLLKAQERLTESEQCYRQALALNPNFAEAHCNLGVILKDMGRLNEAETSYQQAIRLQPQLFRRNLLALRFYQPELQPERFFAELRAYADSFPAQSPPDFPRSRFDPDQRLKIGLLSSDFYQHPVAGNLLPWLRHHNPQQNAFYCYSLNPRQDALTTRLRALTTQWRTVHALSDAQLAAVMRQDGLDILIILAGLFDSNRPQLCRYRLAPVQISWHDGASSGFSEMDWWLTDAMLHPESHQELFTEQLYRLPCFYQFQPLDEEGALPLHPVLEPKTAITFASFNNPCKLNDGVLATWGEILRQVPSSRLLLKYRGYFACAGLQQRVVALLAQQGVGAERVVFASQHEPLLDHLSRLCQVDIALDPFPFNGATTTYQALWMGVPVVALAGERFLGRVGAALLGQVGVSELVAPTREAYVATAVALAGDAARLAQYHRTLRQRVIQSPLCQGAAYGQSLTIAMRALWRQACQRLG